MHAWLTEFYYYGKKILKTSTDSVVVKVEVYQLFKPSSETKINMQRFLKIFENFWDI